MYALYFEWIQTKRECEKKSYINDQLSEQWDTTIEEKPTKNRHFSEIQE